MGGKTGDDTRKSIEAKRAWILEQIRKAPARDVLLFERICIQFAKE